MIFEVIYHGFDVMILKIKIKNHFNIFSIENQFLKSTSSTITNTHLDNIHRRNLPKNSNFQSFICHQNQKTVKKNNLA